MVSHVFGRATWSILLPAISDDLAASFTAVGFLGASNFAGYMLGVIAVTALASRVEPITFLRTGLAVAAFSLVLLTVSPTFGVLAAGIAFIGFAGAGIWIAAPSVATRDVPASRRGLVLGMLTASMGLATLVVSEGTTVYRKAIEDDGAWRPIFGVEAIVTIGILAGAIFIVRPGQTQRTEQHKRLFSSEALRSIPQWVLLLSGYTLYSFLAGSWSQFLGLTAENDAGFTRTQATQLFSVFAVAGMIGPLIMGSLSDRIGRDRSLVIACSCTALSSLCVAFGSKPFFVAGVAMFAFFAYSVPPLTAGAVRDHLSDRAFGSAFGLMTIVYGLGSLVAAQVGGWIADVTGGFTTVYFLLAVLAFMSAGASLARDIRLRSRVVDPRQR